MKPTILEDINEELIGISPLYIPIQRHPEGSLRELNLSRSSRASAERPFTKFANQILRVHAQSRVRWSGGNVKKDGCPFGYTTRKVPKGTIFAHKIARKRQSLFGQKCGPDSATPTACGTRFSACVARQKRWVPVWVPIFFGGATRNRTGDRGVADLCLTAWPWRHI